MANDSWFQPATDLSRAVRSDERGATEQVEGLFERIDRCNDVTNAYVHILSERAQAAAADADNGTSGNALQGVPVAVKDNLDVAGVPTTFGAVPMADNVPKRSALAVDRVEDAGAVIVGKTNTPRVRAPKHDGQSAVRADRHAVRPRTDGWGILGREHSGGRRRACDGRVRNGWWKVAANSGKRLWRLRTQAVSWPSTQAEPAGRFRTHAVRRSGPNRQDSRRRSDRRRRNRRPTPRRPALSAGANGQLLRRGRALGRRPACRVDTDTWALPGHAHSPRDRGRDRRGDRGWGCDRRASRHC